MKDWESVELRKKSHHGGDETKSLPSLLVPGLLSSLAFGGFMSPGCAKPLFSPQEKGPSLGCRLFPTARLDPVLWSRRRWLMHQLLITGSHCLWCTPHTGSCSCALHMITTEFAGEELSLFPVYRRDRCPHSHMNSPLPWRVQYWGLHRDSEMLRISHPSPYCRTFNLPALELHTV